MDEVLYPVVRLFSGTTAPNSILMQDNARPHTAGIAMAYLDQDGLEVME